MATTELSPAPSGESTHSLAQLAARIDADLSSATRRLVVAIAGAPGSGKSTAAEALQARLIEHHERTTQIVPMDGFHYDNAVLQPSGWLARKGAPETFDVGGLQAVLKRLSEPEPREAVAVPVFDRRMELSRAGARLIEPPTQVVLVEGNYLLLQQAPWSALAPYFGLSVILPCPLETLRTRLMKRWLDLGFTEAQALEKVQANDLLNAQSVIENSRRADVALVWTLT